MQNVYRISDFASARSPLPVPPPTDEALIASIAQGERGAMQVLFGRHHAPVYRFAARITGNPSLAEDIVSDVFLDVWRRADRFAGRSKVSTWLLAITRYKAINAMRDRAVPLEAGVAETLVDPGDDPETVMGNRDRQRIMRTCLGQLNPMHREIIDLVYYHRATIFEAARMLRIPVGTVKTRMYYARRQLAELLEKSGLRRELLS
jgi:RNA polymerase sigma-70 factor (ECF subfamily)